MYQINIRRIVRIFLAVCFVFYSLTLIRVNFIKKETAKTPMTQLAIHDEHLKIGHSDKHSKLQHLSGGQSFIDVNADSITSVGNITMDNVNANTITLSGHIYAQNVKSKVGCMYAKVSIIDSDINQLSVAGDVWLSDCKIDTLKIIPIGNCMKRVIKLTGNTVCKKIINASSALYEIERHKTVIIKEPIEGANIAQKII